MTCAAAELIQVAPSLFIWQSYDPSVKADLFATALVTSAGIFVVDPIPLERSELDRLRVHGRITGVHVTNANHHRAAIWYADQFSVPLFAARDVFPEQKPPHLVQVENAERIQNGLEVIQIEGAVAGEAALYHEPNGGTLIVGDALINFEPYGFAFLPRRYCRDEKQMHRSLRKLLDRNVSRIFFAHGMPILSDASTRLRQLLDAGL